jgi:ATP/maltotriose-dependent transcriptional regulator MalT
MIERWPLIGREDVLDHVATALGRRELTGVVLAGPAGVGKTRLALECRDIGARTGFATAVAFASRAANGIPLGALAPILPPIDVAAERGVAMLQQAREGLQEMAGDRPLLLVVDDAQLLDDASALLLQQLVQAEAAFVVVTIRSGEPVPDPVVSLWKDGLAQRIEVGPLTREDLDQLMAEVLGGPVEGTTLQELWTASEGNALYLREVVLSGIESGALVQEAGLWRLTAGFEPSSRLTDLVEARLSGLEPDEVDALELVAFGEPIGVELIEQLASASALEALERKGVVVTELDERRIQARLAHPLHGEVLRDRIPPLRARSVRRSLADAVEAAGARRRGDVLRVAVWRLDAGGDATAASFVQAAQQAKFANDFGVALRLAQRAYEVEPTFESGHTYADVLYDLGETELLEEVLGNIADLAAGDGEIALHAMLRGFNLYWRLARGRDARKVLEEASDVVTDPEWHAEVQGALAVIDATSGNPQGAVERTAPILARSEGRAFAQSSLAVALGLPLLGLGEEAILIAERGHAAHLALGDQLSLYEPALLLVAKSLALTQLGRLHESEALAREVYDDSLTTGEAAGWAFSAMALGSTYLEQGRVKEADRWWKEAASLFRAVEHNGPYRWALAGMLLSQALLRDVEGLADIRAELERTAEHPASMHELDVQRAEAWMHMVEGDPAESRTMLVAAADEAEAAEQKWEELLIRHEVVRLGGDPGDSIERIVDLAGDVQGELAQQIVRHVQALVDKDADALGEVSTAFEQSGSLLRAAEAATAAADAYRRAGNQRAATSWGRQGAELARRCEGARTPGLVDAAGPTPLTKREREIALLAAEGLTSREIAERLYVSVRTIDNHLARVYDKLGVKGRDDLRAVLS